MTLRARLSCARPTGVAGAMTHRLVSDDVERAAACLRAGGLVAIPTETVYGLAASVDDAAAVQRIFDVKGRPAGHPLIVHLEDGDGLDRWSDHPSDAARRLAAAAWPGPLTIIVPRSDRVPDVVTGGRDTVGLRVPAHPMTRRLLRMLGTAVAAPSANRFGAVSPTSADHVLADLGERLDPMRDMVLDGGASDVGVESTIVDTVSVPPQILRTGAVTAGDVAALLATELGPSSGPARASGMLESHYAPRAEVRVVDSADDAVALRAGTPGAVVLDLSDDLAVYARRLYAELRAADAVGASMVIAVLPPAHGLGHAIRDRLTKAAAPRI